MSGRGRLMSDAAPSSAPRPRVAAPDDRLAVFLRGLVVGALVGAILAGSAALRRAARR